MKKILARTVKYPDGVPYVGIGEHSWPFSICNALSVPLGYEWDLPSDTEITMTSGKVRLVIKQLIPHEKSEFTVDQYSKKWRGKAYVDGKLVDEQHAENLFLLQDFLAKHSTAKI